jgi:hypothetical protein
LKGEAYVVEDLLELLMSIDRGDIVVLACLTALIVIKVLSALAAV